MDTQTKVAITSKSFSNNPELLAKLKENFSILQINSDNRLKTKNDIIEFLKDCDAAIVGLDPIDGDVLDACPNLKYISKYGVGLNNLDFNACRSHNIKIGWTGGVNRTSVAEMALGFMLGLSRNLFYTSTLLSKGEWKKDGGFQLSEKSIGIIGCGFAGKELVRLLKPFNCKIYVNDIINQDDYYQSEGLIKATKEEIYANCDLITVHTPLTDETHNLLNWDTMNMCKQRPYLINTARGGIINEKDIVKAIDEGIISGAAIDPFEIEPLNDEALYSHPKIITTPHIGGNAKEAVLAMGYAAISNLIEIVKTNKSTLEEQLWH